MIVYAQSPTKTAHPMRLSIRAVSGFRSGGVLIAGSLEVRRPTMNLILWMLQVLLAVAFFAHGWMLLFPPENVGDVMNATIPPAFRLFLGVAEVAAASGLTLPGVTRIFPGLIPVACAGLIVVTVGATVLHLMRGEYNSALITAILCALVTFVGYMRWTVMPIRPRAAAA
jgi:uncharacterized membrane protein YphA (DoxX/SURF4 family)